MKMRKSNEFTPVYSLMEEYPRTLSDQIFLTLNPFTTMDKLQQKAQITLVEKPENIDEKLYPNRARIVFSFINSEANDDDDDVTDLLVSMTRNNTYSVLVNYTGKNFEDIEKLVGKTTWATVYLFKITELFANTKDANKGYNIVSTEKYDKKNGKFDADSRQYSKLNVAYVGKFDDEKAAFSSVQKRMLSSLEDGDFYAYNEEEL